MGSERGWDRGAKARRQNLKSHVVALFVEVNF